MYILDQATPEETAFTATRFVKDTYQKYLSNAIDVACIMLDSKESDLQELFMEVSGPLCHEGTYKGHVQRKGTYRKIHSL